MSPNFRIALRFLTAKKRAMLMSLSCIVLGVGLFVVTQATTSGFQGFFIKTILGTNGAILIQDKLQATMRSIDAGGYNSGYEIRQKEGQKYIEGIDYPDAADAGGRERSGTCRAVSAVLRGHGHDPQLLPRADRARPTASTSRTTCRSRTWARRSCRARSATSGCSRAAPSSGGVIADKLQLDVGDTFEMVNLGDIHHYKVSAIYQTGVNDIDSVRVYLKMERGEGALQEADRGDLPPGEPHRQGPGAARTRP